MESDDNELVASCSKPKKTRLFSEGQRCCLKAFYDSGMTGTGEQFKDLHLNCAKESGLSVLQVTVREYHRYYIDGYVHISQRWIKKKSYQQRHARRSKMVDIPVVKRPKQTAWHRHLKAFGSTKG